MHSGYPILHKKCLPLKTERNKNGKAMRNIQALKDITVDALKPNKKQPERGKLIFSFISLIF